MQEEKRKYRQLDSRLQRLKDSLRRGEMDVVAYADATSHLIHFEWKSDNQQWTAVMWLWMCWLSL